MLDFHALKVYQFVLPHLVLGLYLQIEVDIILIEFSIYYAPGDILNSS